MKRPLHVTLAHWDEWVAKSGVDPELTAINVKSLAGVTGYDYLLYSEHIPRRNDGRLTNYWLKKYCHLEHGGWWCGTVLNQSWGCFKPDKPRRDKEKGKPIKYEHPPRTDTGLFALKVPFHLWQQIAERYSVVMPDGLEQRKAGGRRQTAEGIYPNAEDTSLGVTEREQAPTERSSVAPVGIQTPLERNLLPPASCPLPSDRLYYAFWQWVIQSTIPVVITEGAKKAGALLTAGYVAVALPGVFNGYRQPKDEMGNPTGNARLIPELAQFATPGRTFYFAFDADSKPKTIANVSKAIAQIGWLLEQQGCQVQVIGWSSKLGKGVDDLIAGHGVEAFDAAYKASKALSIWKASQLRRLTYEPSIRVDRRYLATIPLPDDVAKLIALKAPKGTGKTELISEWVSEAVNNGQWVLVITHRIQLGEALCQRFGVPYVTELKESETGAVFGYGLCVDSLHPKSQARFHAENWEDGVVILDEAEQVLWHMLNSSTCQNERVPILKSFKTLIQNVLRSDEGRVILSDADLTDVSIDYIKQLAAVPLTPYVIQNDYRKAGGRGQRAEGIYPNAEDTSFESSSELNLLPPASCPLPSQWKPSQGWDVYQYGGKSPEGLMTGLLAHINEGGKPFICVSAQRRKSKWSTTTLEKFLRSQYPEKRILRIDSESVSDPTHPAYCCISNLNEILLGYDMVVSSPSIETGVSIDIIGHFTSVWGITYGINAVTSFLQTLSRIREDVSRFIWVSERGLGAIGNGATSIKNLLASQHKLTKANIGLLQTAGFDAFDSGGGFEQESLVTWAKMATRINATMPCYREAVVEALRAEGHTVTSVEDIDPDGMRQVIGEAIIQTRDDNYAEERKAIEAASDITEKEYLTLKEQRAKTLGERHQERKYSIGLRYGIKVSSELVARDDKGFYQKLRLLYYASVGREYLSDRDKRIAQAQIDVGVGDVWQPDFNASQIGLKVAALDVLGITPLLSQPGRELRNSDPEVQAIASLAQSNPWQIKAVLGLSVGLNEAPIRIVGRLVQLAGGTLTYLRREGSRGDRERVYQLVFPDDEREEIFAVWLARDVSKREDVSTSLIDQINTEPVDEGQVTAQEASHWRPAVGGFVRWLGKGAEKLVVLAAEVTGQLQVRSLVSGLIFNTSVSRVEPV